MKQALLILGIFFISTLMKAQTVENIHTKQVGEKINIYYQIKNSWDDQFFKVTISCLINNNRKIVLKSITGDVGDNIIGGKDEYRAVWDVLKDVDELTNAEFFVQIEQKDDGTLISPGKTKEGFKLFKYQKENKGQFFLAYQFMIGGKFGYMGKWGFAVSAGMDIFQWEPSYLGYISKSIVKKQDVQWNIYAIVGTSLVYEYDYDDGYDSDYFALAIGLGTDVAIGHLYLNFSSHLAEGEYLYLTPGIGWRF